ncbi:Uncharacterised protein [Candidatus Burarchaeum australiense]|nr:Uncharacterised protein [Candidatus Burarchaeum australiense]
MAQQQVNIEDQLAARVSALEHQPVTAQQIFTLGDNKFFAVVGDSVKLYSYRGRGNNLRVTGTAMSSEMLSSGSTYYDALLQAVASWLGKDPSAILISRVESDGATVQFDNEMIAQISVGDGAAQMMRHDLPRVGVPHHQMLEMPEEGPGSTESGTQAPTTEIVYRQPLTAASLLPPPSQDPFSTGTSATSLSLMRPDFTYLDPSKLSEPQLENEALAGLEDIRTFQVQYPQFTRSFWDEVAGRQPLSDSTKSALLAFGVAESEIQTKLRDGTLSQTVLNKTFLDASFRDSMLDLMDQTKHHYEEALNSVNHGNKTLAAQELALAYETNRRFTDFGLLIGAYSLRRDLETGLNTLQRLTTNIPGGWQGDLPFASLGTILANVRDRLNQAVDEISNGDVYAGSAILSEVSGQLLYSKFILGACQDYYGARLLKNLSRDANFGIPGGLDDVLRSLQTIANTTQAEFASSFVQIDASGAEQYSLAAATNPLFVRLGQQEQTLAGLWSGFNGKVEEVKTQVAEDTGHVIEMIDSFKHNINAITEVAPGSIRDQLAAGSMVMGLTQAQATELIRELDAARASGDVNLMLDACASIVVKMQKYGYANLFKAELELTAPMYDTGAIVNEGTTLSNEDRYSHLTNISRIASLNNFDTPDVRAAVRRALLSGDRSESEISRALSPSVGACSRDLRALMQLDYIYGSKEQLTSTLGPTVLETPRHTFVDWMLLIPELGISAVLAIKNPGSVQSFSQSERYQLQASLQEFGVNIYDVRQGLINGSARNQFNISGYSLTIDSAWSELMEGLFPTAGAHPTVAEASSALRALGNYCRAPSRDNFVVLSSQLGALDRQLAVSYNDAADSQLQNFIALSAIMLTPLGIGALTARIAALAAEGTAEALSTISTLNTIKTTLQTVRLAGNVSLFLSNAEELDHLVRDGNVISMETFGALLGTAMFGLGAASDVYQLLPEFSELEGLTRSRSFASVGNILNPAQAVVGQTFTYQLGGQLILDGVQMLDLGSQYADAINSGDYARANQISDSISMVAGDFVMNAAIITHISLSGAESRRTQFENGEANRLFGGWFADRVSEFEIQQMPSQAGLPARIRVRPVGSTVPWIVMEENPIGPRGSWRPTGREAADSPWNGSTSTTLPSSDFVRQYFPAASVSAGAMSVLNWFGAGVKDYELVELPVEEGQPVRVAFRPTAGPDAWIILERIGDGGWRIAGTMSPEALPSSAARQPLSSTTLATDYLPVMKSNASALLLQDWDTAGGPITGVEVPASGREPRTLYMRPAEGGDLWVVAEYRNGRWSVTGLATAAELQAAGVDVSNPAQISLAEYFPYWRSTELLRATAVQLIDLVNSGQILLVADDPAGSENIRYVKSSADQGDWIQLALVNGKWVVAGTAAYEEIAASGARQARSSEFLQEFFPNSAAAVVPEPTAGENPIFNLGQEPSEGVTHARGEYYELTIYSDQAAFEDRLASSNSTEISLTIEGRSVRAFVIYGVRDRPLLVIYDSDAPVKNELLTGLSPTSPLVQGGIRSYPDEFPAYVAAAEDAARQSPSASRPTLPADMGGLNIGDVYTPSPSSSSDKLYSTILPGVTDDTLLWLYESLPGGRFSGIKINLWGYFNLSFNSVRDPTSRLVNRQWLSSDAMSRVFQSEPGIVNYLRIGTTGDLTTDEQAQASLVGREVYIFTPRGTTGTFDLVRGTVRTIGESVDGTLCVFLEGQTNGIPLVDIFAIQEVVPCTFRELRNSYYRASDTLQTYDARTYAGTEGQLVLFYDENGPHIGLSLGSDGQTLRVYSGGQNMNVNPLGTRIEVLGDLPDSLFAANTPQVTFGPNGASTTQGNYVDLTYSVNGETRHATVVQDGPAVGNRYAYRDADGNLLEVYRLPRANAATDRTNRNIYVSDTPAPPMALQYAPEGIGGLIVRLPDSVPAEYRARQLLITGAQYQAGSNTVRLTGYLLGEPAPRTIDVDIRADTTLPYLQAPLRAADQALIQQMPREQINNIITDISAQRLPQGQFYTIFLQLNDTSIVRGTVRNISLGPAGNPELTTLFIDTPQGTTRTVRLGEIQSVLFAAPAEHRDAVSSDQVSGKTVILYLRAPTDAPGTFTRVAYGFVERTILEADGTFSLVVRGANGGTFNVAQIESADIIQPGVSYKLPLSYKYNEGLFWSGDEIRNGFSPENPLVLGSVVVVDSNDGTRRFGIVKLNSDGRAVVVPLSMWADPTAMLREAATHVGSVWWKDANWPTRLLGGTAGVIAGTAVTASTGNPLLGWGTFALTTDLTNWGLTRLWASWTRPAGGGRNAGWLYAFDAEMRNPPTTRARTRSQEFLAGLLLTPRPLETSAVIDPSTAFSIRGVYGWWDRVSPTPAQTYTESFDLNNMAPGTTTDRVRVQWESGSGVVEAVGTVSRDVRDGHLRLTYVIQGREETVDLSLRSGVAAWRASGLSAAVRDADSLGISTYPPLDDVEIANLGADLTGIGDLFDAWSRAPKTDAVPSDDQLEQARLDAGLLVEQATRLANGDVRNVDFQLIRDILQRFIDRSTNDESAILTAILDQFQEITGRSLPDFLRTATDEYRTAMADPDLTYNQRENIRSNYVGSVLLTLSWALSVLGVGGGVYATYRNAPEIVQPGQSTPEGPGVAAMQKLTVPTALTTDQQAILNSSTMSQEDKARFTGEYFPAIVSHLLTLNQQQLHTELADAGVATLDELFTRYVQIYVKIMDAPADDEAGSRLKELFPALASAYEVDQRPGGPRQLMRNPTAELFNDLGKAYATAPEIIPFENRTTLDWGRAVFDLGWGPQNGSTYSAILEDFLVNGPPEPFVSAVPSQIQLNPAQQAEYDRVPNAYRQNLNTYLTETRNFLTAAENQGILQQILDGAAVKTADELLTVCIHVYADIMTGTDADAVKLQQLFPAMDSAYASDQQLQPGMRVFIRNPTGELFVDLASLYASGNQAIPLEDRTTRDWARAIFENAALNMGPWNSSVSGQGKRYADSWYAYARNPSANAPGVGQSSTAGGEGSVQGSTSGAG